MATEVPRGFTGAGVGRQKGEGNAGRQITGQDVNLPQNTRDPGLNINANQFGAAEGRGMQQFASGIEAIGNAAFQLKERRRTAEDGVFRAKARAETNRRMYQAYIDSQSAAESAGGILPALQPQFEQIQADVLSELRGQYNPSDEALQQYEIDSIGIASNYSLNALTFENNQRVAGFERDYKQELGNVAEGVLQFGDINGALEEVDTLAGDFSSALHRDTLEANADAARARIIENGNAFYKAQADSIVASAMVDPYSLPDLVNGYTEALAGSGLPEADMRARHQELIDKAMKDVLTDLSDPDKPNSDPEAVGAIMQEILRSSIPATSEDRIAPQVRENLPVHTAVISAANNSEDVPANVALAIAQVESSMNPDAEASGSSATGLFQFVEQTWLETFKENGAANGLGEYADAIYRDADGKYRVDDPAVRQAILDLRKNADVASIMGVAHTAKNTKILRGSLGREPTPGEVYAAHFLGVGGASLIFAAGPDANLHETLLSVYGNRGYENVVRSNAFLSQMSTVGDFQRWADGKMNRAMGAANAISPPSEQRTPHTVAPDGTSRVMAETLSGAHMDPEAWRTISGNLNKWGQERLFQSIQDYGDAAILNGQEGPLPDEFRQAGISLGVDQDDGNEAFRSVEIFTNPNVQADPTNDKDKKALNGAYSRLAADGIQAMDPDAANALIRMSKMAGVVPPDAADQLETMLASEDDDTTRYALDTIERIGQAVGQEVFNRDFGDRAKSAVAWLRTRGRNTPIDDIVNQWRKVSDPQEQAIRDRFRSDAKELLNGMSTDDVFDALDLGTTVPPNIDKDGMVRGRAAEDYRTMFEDAYVRNGGNEDVAREEAKTQWSSVWGVSPTNNGHLMRYPPERYLPAAPTSTMDGHEWMQRQLRDYVTRYRQGDVTVFREALAENNAMDPPSMARESVRAQAVPEVRRLERSSAAGTSAASFILNPDEVPMTDAELQQQAAYDIYLIADNDTARDAERGRSPTYNIVYVNAAGVAETIPFKFQFDSMIATEAQRIANNEQRAADEPRRQRQQQQRTLIQREYNLTPETLSP